MYKYIGTTSGNILFKITPLLAISQYLLPSFQRNKRQKMKPSFLNWTISAKNGVELNLETCVLFTLKDKKNNAKGLRFAFV